MHVPGVAEHFHDDLDLVGALLLKWHARLSGNLERALMREPLDLESAVASAWHATAEQLPGVRMIIDRCSEAPEGPEMAKAMNRAREHEWARLATAAGLASGTGPAATAAGRRVEEQARLGLLLGPDHASDAPSTAPRRRRADDGAEVAEPVTGPSFVDRIKAVIAA